MVLWVSMLYLLLGDVLPLPALKSALGGTVYWGSTFDLLSCVLPLPALKCTLGGTNGPLRELTGSPPCSWTFLTCIEVRVRQHGWSSKGSTLDLLLDCVLALTCTKVRVRWYGWSSEGAHWIFSLVVNFPYLHWSARKATRMVLWGSTLDLLLGHVLALTAWMVP